MSRRSRTAAAEHAECRQLPVSRVVTAKGVAVDLSYSWDALDGIAEGWTLHQLNAVVDGEQAGYLKISYVPSEKARQIFPDAFHYALQRTGRYYAVRRLYDDQPDDAQWGDDQLRAAIESCRGWMVSEERRHLEALSGDGLRDAWSRAKAEVKREHRREYEDFLEFHVDKPLVDYIRVHHGPDRYEEIDGVTHWVGTEQGFLRQGIGTALYEVGAKWMAANGMKLWASGVQSEEAQRAWSALADKHSVTTVAPGKRAGRLDTARRFLDGDLIVLAEEPQSVAA